MNGNELNQSTDSTGVMPTRKPPLLLDRFPKVRSFIAEREFLEGKAREGSWSGPMAAEQRCHREILSGI